MAIATGMTTPQRRVLRVSPLDIDEARKRLKGLVFRTPLVPLNLEDSQADIYLKLENLQPTGSFKVRGAGNAIELLSTEQRAKGVYTCSGGNMAQALAWHAQRHHIPCTAIVPDTAAETKLTGIRRYGAGIIQVPFEEVWKVATDHVYPPLKDRVFVHPFSNAHMIAGNGTIGLEILEDLPAVEAALVPVGGGGLIAGIAGCLKGAGRVVEVYGVEPSNSAVMAASLAAGHIVEITEEETIADAVAGGLEPGCITFSLCRELLDGIILVEESLIKAGMLLLLEHHQKMVEGAGALSLAGLIKDQARLGGKKVALVASGGNISPEVFRKVVR